MAEIWPTGPHTVRSIDLDQPCQRGPEPTTMTAHVDNNDSVVPSFATVEELDFPTLGRWESILTRGRGSACCIPMQHENRSLLVGIQHSKTPSQRNKQLPGNLTANHYLSSLYAFDATAPYKSVAQSGWFCLGFPDYNTTVTTTTTDQPFPLVRATSWRRLELGGRIFACPRIHFVSGMTIKADDPSAVIVAYGINDCLSRLVEIRLSDLKGLLFGGPPVTEPSEFDRQQNNIRLSAKRSDN